MLPGTEKMHKMRTFDSSKKSKKSQKKADKKAAKEAEDEDDPDADYKRMREIMNGPKKRVTMKDIDDMDMTVKKSAEEAAADEQEKIAQMRKEFMSGEDEDLTKIGFVDSDDEVDFTNFRKFDEKNEKIDAEPAKPSLFSRLTGAFQDYTGNRTMTRADLAPILERFTDQLTDRNVSIEVA